MVALLAVGRILRTREGKAWGILESDETSMPYNGGQ